ncbi:MAG: hypothetical protein KAR39_09250 [Thermoplasmata archaeon]|nr:hypothetical protein [Thermoplasmata archaeon]
MIPSARAAVQARRFGTNVNGCARTTHPQSPYRQSGFDERGPEGSGQAGGGTGRATTRASWLAPARAPGVERGTYTHNWPVGAKGDYDDGGDWRHHPNVDELPT